MTPARLVVVLVTAMLVAVVVVSASAGDRATRGAGRLVGVSNKSQLVVVKPDGTVL